MTNGLARAIRVLNCNSVQDRVHNETCIVRWHPVNHMTKEIVQMVNLKILLLIRIDAKKHDGNAEPDDELVERH
eukprot:1511080-Prorocentrum_lima.AAC.1